MMDVREITRLARLDTTSLNEAVDLIQAFADREANAAVVKAIQDSHRSVVSILNASLGSPLVRGDQTKINVGMVG